MIDKRTPTRAEALQVAADVLEESGVGGLAGVLRSLAAAGRATLHVVGGVTGEYSDRSEWEVAAYPDEDTATTHARLAEAEAKALYAGHVEEASYPNSWEVNNRWDRGMQTDYNGVKYEPFPLVLMLDHEEYPKED